MIIKKTKEINGVMYDYAYSDSGRVYTETDEPIENGTDDATVEDYQKALKEFGVEV